MGPWTVDWMGAANHCSLLCTTLFTARNIWGWTAVLGLHKQSPLQEACGTLLMSTQTKLASGKTRTLIWLSVSSYKYQSQPPPLPTKRHHSQGQCTSQCSIQTPRNLSPTHQCSLEHFDDNCSVGCPDDRNCKQNERSVVWWKMWNPKTSGHNLPLGKFSSSRRGLRLKVHVW